MYFISALDPLSLILLNGILQLKSKRMITKCLSWRSQLKGIYENSRLMLIWQSRCRIPILRNCTALVYNNQSFSLSVSLFLSLSLSLSSCCFCSVKILYDVLCILWAIKYIENILYKKVKLIANENYALYSNASYLFWIKN